ncbi:receptor-type guanylate cyclase gcy-28-like [Ruditapes philippinarum]|uniref:receptor-type guanylate cyclase gcy-28-like n=1 Tax=Ruditapes philippinarum TaxID=129788 RepID=UPI00295B25A1|nr:receptor-type guanylate cyclase gcy-28-like [Ruditapes philippinarum]
MFERAKGKTFRGMTGNVKVDDNGDREPDYWVWDLVPGATEFHVAMEISLTSVDSEKIQILKEIVWETTGGKAPPSTPTCGFLNENCPPEKSNMVLIISIFTVVAIVLGSAASVTGYLWYRFVHGDSLSAKSTFLELQLTIFVCLFHFTPFSQQYFSHIGG